MHLIDSANCFVFETYQTLSFWLLCVASSDKITAMVLNVEPENSEMGEAFLIDWLSLTANSSYNPWKRRIWYKTDAVLDIYAKVY